MVYSIIKFVSFAFFKLYLDFKIYGKGNIPRKGAFIVAANHASYLDPLLLVVTFRKNLYFIARQRLFAVPLIGWVLKQVKAIPVKRHGKDTGPIKNALSVLREGKILAVFPEGTRSKNRKFKTAKPGVGFIVSKAKVPVLPVYIESSFDAQPRGIRTLKRYPVRVHIGKPIDFSKEPARFHKAELYQAIGDEIMRAIAAMKKF